MEGSSHCPLPRAIFFLPRVTPSSRYLFSNLESLGPMLLNCIGPCLHVLLSNMKTGHFLPPPKLAPFQSFLTVFHSPLPLLLGQQQSLPASPFSFLSLPAQPEPAVRSHLLSESQFLPNSFTSTRKPGSRQLLLLALFCASSK